MVLLIASCKTRDVLPIQEAGAMEMITFEKRS